MTGLCLIIINCCSKWLLFWRSFLEWQLRSVCGNYLRVWRHNDQFDVASLVIGVCQQLFIDLTQRHKAVLARPMPAINLITIYAYVHSSAQHRTKQNALLRLGNRDINIMATTNTVLVNMCNNSPLLLSKRVSRKKHEIKNCIVTLII